MSCGEKGVWGANTLAPFQKERGRGCASPQKKEKKKKNAIRGKRKVGLRGKILIVKN